VIKMEKTVLVIATVLLLAWVLNFVKFVNCDFESPYKCEVIHAIGIFTPGSIVTVWFDDDNN